MPVALAVIAGIIVDRHAGDLGTRGAWALLAMGLALLAVVVRRWPRISRPAFLTALMALAAGWHHHRWSDLPPNDLARLVDETPRPAWLEGAFLRQPEFHTPDRHDDTGYSQTVIAITAVRDGKSWRAVSGRARVTIAGNAAHLPAGTLLRAAGMLASIAGPTNPGEADFRDSLRSEGVRLRLSIGDLDSIQVVPDRPIWHGRRWLESARSWAHDRLTGQFPPRTAPLGAALLLGRRAAIDPEVHDQFLRTGTLHLLAISGMHLQVMSLALGTACLALGMRPRSAAVAVLVATLGYAILVGPLPSAVRSASMTAIACIAILLGRPWRTANALALAALVNLAWDPTDLFDIGCQLSYLCVITLFWAVPPISRLLERRLSPLDQLERAFEPAWRSGLRRATEWIVQGLIASLVIWVVTLPLVVLRFHLISPIVVLLNIPLVPLTSATLVLAGMTLALAAVWPPLGGPTAWAGGALLELTQRIVNWGVQQPWGHVFAPSPSPVIVLCLYGLFLSLVVLGTNWRGPRRRLALGAFGAWGLVVPALALVPVPATPSPPEMEVLNVGHGLAILVRSGTGRTMLYDCGKMRDPGVGRKRIAPALWAREVRRLDLVVLSHADSDHYNGLADVLDRFAVAEILVPPGFQGPEGSETARLLEMARARGARVREVMAQDQIDLGPELTATVLHPSNELPTDATDNARSIVIDLARGGRHVLLTGDLEEDGLLMLALGPRRPIDVLLAPHHGGRLANPDWFYDWARPRLVVVSQDRPPPDTNDPLGFLGPAGVPCLRTWEQGAIRLIWGESGLALATFRDASPTPTTPGWLAVLDTMTALHATIAIIGIALGLLGCFALAIVEWGAWALVRPGSRKPGPTEPPPWTHVSIKAADQTVLAGSWRAVPNANGRVALLAHGFGEDRSALLERAEALATRGWNVLLVDHRGRGRSGGPWTTFGALETADMRAWLDWLQSQLGSGLRAVAWGRSMGAAIVLRTAAEDPRLRAAVLEAPYPDLRSSVAAWLKLRHLPACLTGPLLRRANRIAGVPLDAPSPLDCAPRVSVPVFIIHGEQDRIAPVPDVQRLVGAFSTPPTRLEVPKAGHHDVFDLGGTALADQIDAFLTAATA